MHSSYLAKLLWFFWYLSDSLFRVTFFLCPRVQFIFRSSFMLPDISNYEEPGWQPDQEEHDIAGELSAIVRTWKIPPLSCLYQNNSILNNCAYLLKDMVRNQKNPQFTSLCSWRVKRPGQASRLSLVNKEGAENLLHLSLHNPFRQVLSRDVYWKLLEGRRGNYLRRTPTLHTAKATHSKSTCIRDFTSRPYVISMKFSIFYI